MERLAPTLARDGQCTIDPPGCAASAADVHPLRRLRTAVMPRSTGHGPLSSVLAVEGGADAKLRLGRMIKDSSRLGVPVLQDLVEAFVNRPLST
jgi:hypothetical protein